MTQSLLKPIDLLAYIEARIHQAQVTHEIHRFDSGAVMVDLWIEDKCYVVQIEEDTIGLSLITENTLLFDLIPDEVFNSITDFKNRFEKLFTAGANR